MSNDQKYYLNQFKALKPDNIYKQSLKLWDGQGNETKTMSITIDSIPVMIQFLENELIRLQKIEDTAKFKIVQLTSYGKVCKNDDQRNLNWIDACSLLKELQELNPDDLYQIEQM